MWTCYRHMDGYTISEERNNASGNIGINSMHILIILIHYFLPVALPFIKWICTVNLFFKQNDFHKSIIICSCHLIPSPLAYITHNYQSHSPLYNSPAPMSNSCPALKWSTLSRRQVHLHCNPPTTAAWWAVHRTELSYSIQDSHLTH